MDIAEMMARHTEDALGVGVGALITPVMRVSPSMMNMRQRRISPFSSDPGHTEMRKGDADSEGRKAHR